MSTVDRLNSWSIQSLSNELEEESVRWEGKDSLDLLRKAIQNLRGPTRLELWFGACYEFDFIERRHQKKAVHQDHIFEALKVTRHVKELTVYDMQELCIMDQILVADDTIAKLKITVFHELCYSRFLKHTCGKGVDLRPLSRILMRGRKIELDLHQVSDYHLPLLASVIAGNATLTSLKLRCKDSYATQRNGMACLLKAIPRCSVLTRLEVTCSAQAHRLDPYVTMLKFPLTLTELSLTGNAFSNRMKPICDALSTNVLLNKLHVYCDTANYGWESCIARVLHRNSSLTELSLLGSIRPNRKIFLALKHNTTLAKLTIPDGHGAQVEKSLAMVVRHNTALSEMSIGIGFMSRTDFPRAISANQTLCVLDLSRSYIDFEFIEALGKALKSNKSLVDLTMHGPIRDMQPYKSLCEGLKANYTLKSLCFSEMSYWGDGQPSAIHAIAAALVVNTGLEHLTLRARVMGSERATLLSIGLEKNTTLNELVLGAPLDSDEVHVLTRGLNLNTSLKHLTLKDLDLDSMTCLADMLTTNNSLEELTIKGIGEWNRNIGCAFANALRVNTSLKCLRLPRELKEDGVDTKAMKEAYNHNPALTCRIQYSHFWSTSQNHSWYYRRLNRTGRRLWADCTFPAKLWPQALALANARSSPQSPDLLFHFVLEKPDMFKDVCFKGDS